MTRQIVDINRPQFGTNEYFKARSLLLCVGSDTMVTQYLMGQWMSLGRDGLSTMHDYARSIGIRVVPSDNWQAPAGFTI